MPEGAGNERAIGNCLMDAENRESFKAIDLLAEATNLRYTSARSVESAAYHLQEPTI